MPVRVKVCVCVEAAKLLQQIRARQRFFFGGRISINPSEVDTTTEIPGISLSHSPTALYSHSLEGEIVHPTHIFVYK